MEEILEKLKMLDYEDHFKSFRPLTHTYFAMPSSNPNEQFYYFTSLVSWLLSLLGQSWKAPSQLDDPNSAVASLYAVLQQIGAPTNFGAMKLKSGCGDAVCSVLKHLLDLIPIEFHPPAYPEEEAYEEAAVDEEAEVEAEEMADEVGAAEVEEEEMYYHGGARRAGGRARPADRLDPGRVGRAGGVAAGAREGDAAAQDAGALLRERRRERVGDHAPLTHARARARVRAHTYTPSLPSNPPTHPPTTHPRCCPTRRSGATGWSTPGATWPRWPRSRRRPTPR